MTTEGQSKSEVLMTFMSTPDLILEVILLMEKILHRLGYPKRIFYSSIKTFSGIASGAGFFPVACTTSRTEPTGPCPFLFFKVAVFPAPQCSTSISMVSATTAGGGRNTWSFVGVFAGISAKQQGGAVRL